MPPPTDVQSYRSKAAARRSERRRISEEGLGVWTRVEHDRFLEAKRLYPHGPWKLVAEFVGTRNTRQTMTHAQKYRQKLERRRRGLHTTRKVSEFEHVLRPELYFPSSPTPSEQSQGPLKPTQSSTPVRASSKSVVTDEIQPVVDDDSHDSTVALLASCLQSAPQPATCTTRGGFEQLPMDDTGAFCFSTLVALESCSSDDVRMSTPPTTAASAAALATTIADKSVVELSSPTHHGDVELPWLDECLDYLIDNLR